MTYDAFRNFDAWLTTDPNGDYVEPPLYKCEECGGFLRHEPDSSEWIESKQRYEDITGEWHYEDWSFTRHHRECPKCGNDNLEDDL